MYVRTSIKADDIKKLKPGSKVHLCNCTVAYTVEITSNVTIDNNRFIAAAHIIERRSKPKKTLQRIIAKTCNLFNWFHTKGRMWPTISLPPQTDVNLTFSPTFKKVRMW